MPERSWKPTPRLLDLRATDPAQCSRAGKAKRKNIMQRVGE